MKRKDETDEQVIRWKKSGRGTFRTKDGRIIKPGQQFDALESEIPQAFRDTIVPVDPATRAAIVPGTKANKEPVVSELEYYVKHVTSGWYNVEDANGKVMNEKKLRSEKANELLASLVK